MSYEQKDMQGSLFKNDRKESDNHPDYQGSCVIGGEEMWMSAWLKTSAEGKRWMSFSFKPKESKAPPKRETDTRTHAQRKQRDDDIPF